MPPLSDSDVVHRRPVWSALSDLFLDTSLTGDDLDRIAGVLARSPYSLDQLDDILLWEVYPACRSNLYAIAGEWAEFDSDWLESTIQRGFSPIAMSWAGTVGRLGRYSSRSWRSIKARIHAERAIVPAPATPLGPEERSSVTDDNDFALAMYLQLRQQAGNVFFSPFSIRAVLAMAAAGARGETAAQIDRVLRGTLPGVETLHADIAAIIERLRGGCGGKYEMAIANSLWAQDGAPMQTEFLDLLTRHYGGGLNRVDFRRRSDAARTSINRWVGDQTKNTIRELIPVGGLDADTRFVLANAVYFKGKWLLRFSESATREEPFYLEAGGTVQTPLMYQQDQFRYVQADGFQAIDLLYEGLELSLLVLLPNRKNGLGDLETRLSAQMVRDCVARMTLSTVNVLLPRFAIESGLLDVCPELVALDITHAFNRSRADFSGINGFKAPHDEALFISAVYHRAWIAVTEEGTEASAATATEIEETAFLDDLPPPPTPVFRADHPFLFALRDRPSGAFLFLGRVSDPAAA